jgi:hypothetical protein
MSGYQCIIATDGALHFGIQFKLENADKTELARQPRKALETVIDKLNFSEKTSSQRDVAEELKHCKKMKTW